jgi:hypothetical protein
MLLEQFHRQVVLAAVADRSIEHRRFGAARQLDEFLQCFGRHRRIYSKHELVRRQTRNRHQVLERIERHPAVDVRVAHEHVVGAMEQRVAVRRGMRRDIACEIAARARPVLDDDGLSQPHGQRLPIKPSDEVHRPARRIGNNDPDRTVGPGLRECSACQRGENERGRENASDHGRPLRSRERRRPV